MPKQARFDLPGTNLTVPFTALGMPDTPVRVTTIKGNNAWGLQLSFAGFVSAAVEDVYNNPISNVTVTFSVAGPVQIPGYQCAWRTIDPRKTYFIESGLACLKNSPTWGQCGDTSKQELTTVTDSTGAAVAEVILGGMDGAKYTVTAKALSLSPATFELYTVELIANRADPCDGKSDPYRALMTNFTYTSDIHGHSINAGKTGTTIPVTASMYCILENWAMKDVACGSGTCRKVAGTRQWETSTNFTDSSMTFGITPGTSQGGGVFTSNYQLKPGKNEIPIKGRATTTVRNTHMSCPGICNTVDETLTQTGTTTMTVYGVEVKTQLIPMLLVNESGYLSSNQTITYTIEPLSSDYRAMSANTFIYKDSTLVAQIPTETKGTGTAIISRGFQFDVNSIYEAEVVLNYGTGMEIRGDRVKLPVGQVRVLTSEYPEKTADEIKFGTGADQYEWQKKKIYQINLQSAVFTNNCAGLSGKLSIINQNGQIVTLPTGDGQAYAAEYQLKGDSTINGCRLQIIDTLANKTQNYFIVSNRSRAVLNEGWLNYNVTDKAVLYGGIGSRVKIEVNGVQKYVPIEPVNIIVLGIDGLRQDVLYSVEEQHVNELNVDYYVQSSELKGLCDVLGGKFGGTSCDPTGWENKHIKLKDVTAIFPSITLASWASIFSGKMPNETGITGNEFFARDLNTKHVPLKFNNPTGMITFDSGAFKGYDEYNLWNMLWANKEDKSYFFVPYQFDWKTSVDPVGTPQNDKGIYKAETVFESIKAMPGINSYFNANGGDPVVVSYSHYARGAYWLTWNTEIAWGESRTLDKASWSKFNEYLNGKYLTSNVRITTPFSALTVWYLPGLDHQAHIKGMDAYKSYFTGTTDDYIWNLAMWLKSNDEFDNKIFVIVADHGHTAMPTELTYQYKWEIVPDSGIYSEMPMPAEMSCKLKTSFDIDAENPEAGENNRKAEKANNNLHIWELGEVFKAVGNIQGTSVPNEYKVLAPKEIASIFVDDDGDELPAGATKDITNAHVIAALNGPMAHIYVQNASSGVIAEIFRLMLQREDSAGALRWLELEDIDYKQIRTTMIGRLQNSIDKVLIRINGNYCVFDGLNDNGSANCAINETLTSLAYVDPWTRINGMNNLNRSGDIVLIMNDTTLGDAKNRYTTGVACKSWHGSLNPSDSYVPFIFAYPGGNKAELETMLTKDGVCGSDYSKCKANWKLPDIIKEIISEQYK